MTKLSSNATFFFKVIFPTVWLICFGSISIILLLRSYGGYDMSNTLILFPCFFAIGFIIFAFSFFKIKHVSLSNSYLIIRGLKKEIEIPISDVLLVRCTSMQNPEIITLKLKKPSIFGSKIKFMPRIRFIRFSAHPALRMLQELMESSS